MNNALEEIAVVAPSEHQLRIERLARLAQLLDANFKLPGTKVKVGIDPIMSLIPGVGDALSAAFSGYIVLEAKRLGAPKSVIRRMLWNIAVDGVVGTVPLLGDLFDVSYKANLRNVTLLQRWFDDNQRIVEVPGTHNVKRR